MGMNSIKGDTVYLSIRNDRGALSQNEWSNFAQDVFRAVGDYSLRLMGVWFSLPDAEFQSACWAFHRWEEDPEQPKEQVLMKRLSLIAKKYDNDSITWAEGITAFVPKAEE